MHRDNKLPVFGAKKKYSNKQRDSVIVLSMWPLAFGAKRRKNKNNKSNSVLYSVSLIVLFNILNSTI